MPGAELFLGITPRLNKGSGCLCRNLIFAGDASVKVINFPYAYTALCRRNTERELFYAARVTGTRAVTCDVLIVLGNLMFGGSNGSCCCCYVTRRWYKFELCELFICVCVCAMRCFFGAFFDMKISFYNVTCVYERAGNVKRQFIAI